MTLDTLINTALVPPARPVHALVLAGGGARTAYQAGVLRALARLLESQPDAATAFPFQVLVGTSAGALNCAYLASAATRGLGAFDELAGFWCALHGESIYRLRSSRWTRLSRLLGAVRLWGQARRQGALLDTQPLVQTLRRRISLPGIEASLESGALDALAVTASSYTTGMHWTFCQTGRHSPTAGWRRPGRRGEPEVITIEHLLASSALPLLFPAMPLQVDGGHEFFGDGSMRQISPLSPALRLGAHRILVIGVGQPDQPVPATAALQPPGLGAIAAHALASVFHNSLQADVEEAQRLTRTLAQLPREIAAVLPYRPLDVRVLYPSRSLDLLASEHLKDLPRDMRRALAGLEPRRQGASLASYLLFEPAFIRALIGLGEQDALDRKSELLSFFDRIEPMRGA